MSLEQAMDSTPGYTASRCPLGHLLDALDDDDRATLEAWLATVYRNPPPTQTEHFPNWRIGRALRNAGHPIANNAVKDHRRKVCGCYA